MKRPLLFKSAEGERAVAASYDSLLARLPVPHSGVRIPTRHGETFVIVAGEPAHLPIVLLHSASSNSGSWGEDFVRFTRSCRVYAVDIPGEPGKSAPNRMALCNPHYGEWLLDVLDGLGLEKSCLLGYSQGGWTALRFATLWPERVERMVLVAPGGIAPPRISLMFKLLPLLVLGRWGRESVKRTIFGARRLPADLDLCLNLILEHFIPRMGKEYIFNDNELRRLTMPILLVTGGRDAVRDTPRMVERLCGLVPQVERRDYPELGHLLFDLADDILPFVGGRQRK
jgi:pimeloyl-ACP methyl ester carboxylesterase